MKRHRLRCVALFVLLISGGAIVNVAVAWLAPLRCRHYESVSGNLQRVDRDWNWLEDQGWPLAGNYTWRHMWQGAGWRSDHFALKRPIDIDPAVGAPLAAWRDRSGWPLYALEYYGQSGSGDFAQFNKRYGGMVIEGTLFGRRRDHGIFVITSPLWPGFAINTIFYAAILWIVFAFLFKSRRWRRIKRGQCPACGYPVGTSEVCTECGKPVARRMTA